MRRSGAVGVVCVFLVLAACGTGSTQSTQPISSSGSTTTQASPTTTSGVRFDDISDGALPIASKYLVYGEDGIVAVTAGGELVRISHDPTAAAYAVGDSLVLSQGMAQESVSPPNRQGPILVHEITGERTLLSEAGEELSLYDAAIIGGKPVAIATVRTGCCMEDTDERLLLIDIVTSERVDLGSVGGWESAVAQAQYAGDLIVVVTTGGDEHSAHARSLDGEVAWSGSLGSFVTMVVTETEAVFLAPKFKDDFRPVLGIAHYDLGDGRLAGSESFELSTGFGGGFCLVADWDGESIVCGESYGGPFYVDMTTGDVTRVTSLASGYASASITN